MIGRFSRILVVDGNVASRRATNNVLRGLGHETIDFAADSANAMRMIGHQNYRLIVADWDMAPVNGADILREARLDRRHKALPFLMGIDRWQRKFIEIVREDGATLYVIKPFVAETLAERIAQVSRDADRLNVSEVLRSHGPQTAGREPATIPKLWQLLRPES